MGVNFIVMNFYVFARVKIGENYKIKIISVSPRTGDTYVLKRNL